MSKRTVVIAGAGGTVGMKLAGRLRERGDITVKVLDARAPAELRTLQLDGADIAVLCMPEAAAREFVAAAPPGLRILDASSAHRTAPGWTYGLAELGGDQAQAIRDATHVANPGCYATGAILMLRPLLVDRRAEDHLQVAITAVGGFSTGGSDG